MTRSVSSFLAFLLLVACGGGSQETTPDESADFDPSSGGMAQRIVDMPVGLDGTQWRWVEAHCTEGPLDLASRGFASTVRVHQDGESLLLVHDQTFANEECAQTIVQRVSPPDQPGELEMEEVARVAVPSSDACFGRPEQPRPGEVRRTGDLLEVLVQRSNWCGGFEVRMVYASAVPQLLEDEAIVRRYVAHYGRGDADRLAELFAQSGSLLEPFTQTATGDPYRHDGREAVRAWFRQAFEGTPWRGMRILSIEPGEQPHTMVAEWEYMDPRLAQPLRGRNRFTVAAGEIFEAQIELIGEPVPAPGAGESGTSEETAPPS
ncbi:MAG: nuclear transport factor 2 family protein [Myxococcota bacterium]|nr:nuclear transport factor 2 family protein [Myxococcota bacterium]